MLLKMYKFDMKNVSLPLIVVHAVLLVLTLAEMIMVSVIGNTTSGILEVLVMMVGVLLILTALVAFIMTNLLLIQRFYKRMFTNEGYLTNALPMTADQKILSHTLCYLTWFAIDAILIGLCAMLSVSGTSLFSSFESSYIKFLGLGVLTIILIIVAVSCLLSELAHLSCAIGHLFSGNKGLMTFIFYLVIGAVLQIISLIFVFGSGSVYAHFFSGFSDAAKENLGVFGIFGPFVIIMFIFAMALAAAMYFISRRIIKKHLNLSGS